jgi:HPt (histidine-containing phosphotransfer) domain-containing protein
MAPAREPVLPAVRPLPDTRASGGPDGSCGEDRSVFLTPVDLEAARRLAAGDEDLRAEIATIFVESWQQQRLDLRNALHARDCARIAQIAHTLKGASGTVGAATAQALAGELEALSRKGHQDRLNTLADELERELGRAAEFLTSGSSAGST